ncbi:cation efflux protein [Jaminaea rosea]|uniref:Cation efflux protein n=1 Tax=Jaminaea rosea TaxID=1569628 RepID=A0A316UQX8_9BASI|nr:cation efflux protein [Jaminaea rosea]PWN27384.1 cation efflux protein [Jaminaea rosea]
MSAATVEAPGSGLRQRTKREEHEHDHDHSSHSHSHSLLGGHDHSHAHGSPEEADRLIAALKGKGDRGSNITLLGLFSNIVLCISKGIAGVFLNSASLVADAAHSLSDMFSDLVTLFCWKMSQKPPSQTHPLGYGKYETMGGLGVSVVLVGGAVGIGMHSWGLLLEAMGPMLETAPAFIQTIGHWSGSMAHTLGHSHGAGAHDHAHDAVSAAMGALDPNAMWFALLSVAVKEWLYRATLKVAKDENSSVLEANALHHRSDSLSSGVTFLAIGGSWMGLPILDPLGGLLVAGLIGKQGFDLLVSALAELSDRGVDVDVLQGFEEAVRGVQSEDGRLKRWTDLRAIKSGVSTFIDITLVMEGRVTLIEAREVEDKIREALVDAHKGVKEVRVHFAPSEGK